MDFVYDTWNHLLSSLNQPWLSTNILEYFAQAIYQKSGAIEDCFEFVDGTDTQARIHFIYLFKALFKA